MATAFALIIVIAIVFLVALRSTGADFDGDWLVEDLTCGELVEAYSFGSVMLDQIIYAHNQCMDYANSPADAGFGRLHCELIEKEGRFVQGMVNDIVDVFNAKPECSNP
jgi:hypothetical protein